MLLAMRETIFATMDEQRTIFVCGRVLHVIAWLFAADELESKEQSLLKGGTPAMRLLPRLIYSTLSRIPIQAQKDCCPRDLGKGR